MTEKAHDKKIIEVFKHFKERQRSYHFPTFLKRLEDAESAVELFTLLNPSEQSLLFLATVNKIAPENMELTIDVLEALDSKYISEAKIKALKSKGQRFAQDPIEFSKKLDDIRRLALATLDHSETKTSPGSTPEA